MVVNFIFSIEKTVDLFRKHEYFETGMS